MLPYNLLYTRNMKHVMNFSSHGNLQLIGHFSNFPNYFVGTIKYWFEIFWTFTFYGGLFVGMKLQIHQVIPLELSLHSMFMCILFLLILSNLQVISQSLQNFLTFFNPILSLWSSTITKNVVNKIGRIRTIKCCCEYLIKYY